MKQVFGYTPANPPTGMVGYVAASIDADGNVELTVRQHGADNPAQASMRLPADEARKLSEALSPREAPGGDARTNHIGEAVGARCARHV